VDSFCPVVVERGSVDGSSQHLFLGLIAVFIAGITKGLTGFGFSLVAVPILVVLLGPRTGVPVIVLLNSFTNVFLFLSCRKDAELRRIGPLIIAGISTVPVGMLLLLALDANAVKLIAGCAIVLFAVAFLAGFQRPIRRERWGLASAGLMSGTLNGLISTGGPPVILFLTNQGVTKHVFRASLITYFLFLNLATVPIFTAGGLVTLSVATYAATFLPALIIGALIGAKLLKRVPERVFRIITLLIVMIAGAVSILSSLGVI
jgi:uncharacterized membrane protein YfcA